MTKTKNKRKRNAPVQMKWKGGKQNVNNGAWFETIETNQCSYSTSMNTYSMHKDYIHTTSSKQAMSTENKQVIL